MNRLVLLIGLPAACWFGMQWVHEFGHVVAAWATGGSVRKVVLHPLTISRTDVEPNPKPNLVVWAGPVLGAVLPLAGYVVAAALHMPGAFVLRFFAGFCLLANGAYIGLGSFDRVGDCGTMLATGSSFWSLWLFGLTTAPLGLCFWHGQARHFGLGKSPERVAPLVAWSVFAVAILLAIGGVLTGAE